MNQRNIIEVTQQIIYAKPVGVESNDSMVGLIDPQDITSRICERILDGQRVKVYEITSDELEAFIEGRIHGSLKINTYLGSLGEKVIVRALLGIKSGDVTVKRELDKVIANRLIALRLASRPSREEHKSPRSKKPHRRPIKRVLVFNYSK
ncbi:MAG: hypothetical protein PHG25_01055 [Candidatus Pacebacteria bacterium]|nr:hypothetical protein [Candidatus Paceibacterota bacterium]